MSRTDRRKIEPLLGPVFPSMIGASSDDWHAFLNERTGIDVPPDEDNARAFDRWRAALTAQNIDTGFPTPSQITALQARGRELKAREDKRVVDLPKTQAALAAEAPSVTARDLLNARKAV